MTSKTNYSRKRTILDYYQLFREISLYIIYSRYKLELQSYEFNHIYISKPSIWHETWIIYFISYNLYDINYMKMTIHAMDHALEQYNGAFWKVETVKTLLTSLIFLIQILNTTSKMNLRPFQQIFGTLFVLFLVKSDYFRRQKQLNKNFHPIFLHFFSIKNTARTGRPHGWGRTVMDEVLGTFSVIMTYFLRMYSSVYKQKRSQKFGHTYTNFTYK